MSDDATPGNVPLSDGLGRTVPDATIVDRLKTERDLCAAEHADDIANLLHEAVLHITTLEQDACIGRQWRDNSSLEKWFPLTAERLAALEQWARDCRDQVLYPAATNNDDIGRAADGLGQALVAFRLRPNA